MKPTHLLLLLLTSALLMSCQSSQNIHQQLDTETIKALQQIEVEGQVKGAEYILDSYYAVAQETKNIGVIKRGIQIAATSKDFDNIIKFSELWHNTDKLSTEPLIILASANLKKSDIEIAANHTLDFIRKYKPLAPTDIISDYNSLDSSLKTEFVFLLEQEKTSMSKYAAYWQLLTNIAYVDQDIEKTQALNATGLAKHRKNTKLLIQQAELESDKEQALTLLKQSTEKLPNDKVLNLYYARQLMNAERTNEAMTQYKNLANRFSDDEDIQFSYAVLLINNKQDEAAIKKLNALTKLNPNRANYILAALYEDKYDRDKALKYFELVKPTEQENISESNTQKQDDYYIDAQINAIRLLNYKKEYETSLSKLESLSAQYPGSYETFTQLEAETVAQAGRPLEGYAILSLLLSQAPNNDTYLYNRAMLSGSYGELDLFEEDMRALVKKHPNDPTYLNALGYTLAENNIKLDDAETLLREALALSPDNAAINDSWGWLQYRLGNLQEAIVFTELAHQKYYDGEIVAHLGELYWQNGEQEKAVALWNEYLEIDPEHRVLRATMKRFNQL